MRRWQQLAHIDGETGWNEALSDVGAAIHQAARVHVMRNHAVCPLCECRRINTSGTQHLARCAADAGVQRLGYVSPIKVNGECTFPVAASALRKSARPP